MYIESVESTYACVPRQEACQERNTPRRLSSDGLSGPSRRPFVCRSRYHNSRKFNPPSTSPAATRSKR